MSGKATKSKKRRGRPPKGKQTTIAQVKKAILKSGGFLSIAAESLDITVSAVSQRISKSEELQKVIEDIEEKRFDLAESKLIANIKANDQRAIEFYIRHKGQKRGYIPVDKYILETDKPLELKVTWAK
jgi:hypothetical protein